MKTASIAELKTALKELPEGELVELCLRLARYKKDNKDLLTYLLFEAQDEQAFVASVQQETDLQFAELPKANWHATKKSLRKVLRILSRRSKQSGVLESEVEMLLHFCKKLRHSSILDMGNPSHLNIYERQLEKLRKLIKKVHEDLQYDYKKQMAELELPKG